MQRLRCRLSRLPLPQHHAAKRRSIGLGAATAAIAIVSAAAAAAAKAARISALGATGDPRALTASSRAIRGSRATNGPSSALKGSLSKGVRPYLTRATLTRVKAIKSNGGDAGAAGTETETVEIGASTVATRLERHAATIIAPPLRQFPAMRLLQLSLCLHRYQPPENRHSHPRR
jgi:hypothetical protein